MTAKETVTSKGMRINAGLLADLGNFCQGEAIFSVNIEPIAGEHHAKSRKLLLSLFQLVEAQQEVDHELV